MHPPRLHELPPPPSGRKGWPWTEETGAGQNRNGGPPHSPSVTIVTPSYNQAPFLEETIRSVLLQGYPNLEYIVIDGGSRDGSVVIIEKYAPWISYWTSEPDRGQSHAINKGLARATGAILGWLNSDDYFLPDGLPRLADLARLHPDASAWVGGCYDVSKESETIRFHPPRVGGKSSLADWWHDGYFCQPACLFNRKSFEQVGGLDEKLHFTLDVEYWMRLAEVGPFITIDTPVAASRLHGEAKTFQDLPLREVEHIAVDFAADEKEIAKRRLLRFAEEQAMKMRMEMGVIEILHLAADRAYRDVRALWRRLRGKSEVNEKSPFP